MNNQNKQRVQLYELIDYSKPSNEMKTGMKKYSFTESEAHHCNQGFALNGTTKRYVKVDVKSR